MSDLLKNPVVTGVGGAVGGLLIGALLSLSTIDSKIGAGLKRATNDLSSLVEGDDAALSDVTARLAALEQAVSESMVKVSDFGDALAGSSGDVADRVAALGDQVTSDLGARVAALETRIDAVGTDLRTRLATVVSDQTAALRGMMAPHPAVTPAPAPAASATVPAAVALPEGLIEAGPARRVGETFLLADGAVRVFVQRIDAPDGAALLSINRAPARLAVGDTRVVRHDAGACLVGLAAVAEDGVRLRSDCDAPAGNAALGDAYRPGDLAVFGDGQLRVFVSGVIGDEARLAINGLQTSRLRVGEDHAVTVDGLPCTLRVTGIRGTAVLLAGACG